MKKLHQSPLGIHTHHIWLYPPLTLCPTLTGFLIVEPPVILAKADPHLHNSHWRQESLGVSTE